MDQENRHVQRANLLREQGRYKEAIKEAGLALQENPEDVEALCIIGHCKIDAKLYDEAIDVLQKCIHLNPEHDYVYYLLAFAFYQKDWYPKALDYVENAIALYPYHSGYFSLKGNIFLTQQKFQEALDAANEGLQINAEDVACLNCRTTALFRLKRKDEAIETINEALAIDPEDYHTHSNYGWHYLEKGKHKEANNHFKEALRINPNYNYAKEGYKASLKAKLPFYRWLLQYGLWIQNQSKAVRYGIFFGIFFFVRAASAIAKPTENKLIAIVVGVIVFVYLLFVFFSWLGNSLANLYLLVSKQGKFLLDINEKWSAISVGICFSLAIVFGILAISINELLFFGSLIMLGFCVVATELNFPIRLFKGTGRNITAQLVVLFGILGAIGLFIHKDIAMLFGFLSFILFIGFMWSSPFKKT